MGRKFEHYEVATEMGESATTNYRDAFSEYQHFDGSATLYGVDEMGEYSVIMSK